MEEEIDLRIYIDILLKWWWLIIGFALLCGIAAFIFSSLIPPTYEATAGVVAVKSQAEISLGSAFRAVTDEYQGQIQGSTALIDQTTRRLNTLAGMVQDGSIAIEVSNQLSNTLTEEERDPAVLLSQVQGIVMTPDTKSNSGSGGSDTIQIIVDHNDPQKAALIANTWAKIYEQRVNAIYGDVKALPFGDIHDQVVQAQADYNQKQEELLNFLSQDYRVGELQRQIDEDKAIIASLRSGRQTDANTVINKQVDTQQRLFGVTVASEVNANLKIVEQKHSELIHQYDRDVANRQRLQDLLQNAQLMREQLVKGGADGARSNGLAILSLKSKVLALSTLPIDQLQLQIPSVEDLAAVGSYQEQLTAVDALIAAMKAEIANLDDSIQSQELAMESGSGFSYLDQLTPDALAVQDSISGKALQRMENWHGILGYSAVLDKPLSQEIARLEDEVRSLNSEIVRLNGIKNERQQARDLAWKTYSNLLSKEQELNVSKATASSEVRFASQAVPPREPIKPKKMMTTAVALSLGGMLGVFAAFLFDYIGLESDPRKFLKRRAA